MKRLDGLKNYIGTWLKTKWPTYPVYSEVVPANKTFPRIRFTLTSGQTSESPREDITLSIEIYDTSTNTTTIDQIAGDIVGDGNYANPTGLDHKAVSGPDYAFHMYLDNRNEQLTNDEYSRQRNVNFNIKYYSV